MSEIRLGRQTPTVSVVLPYKESKGSEAVAIYNQSGRTAQPWQELLLEDMMAVDSSGLWLHMKFAYSVPRRNGKSELLIMRTLWAITHGEKTLYTAHRVTTSRNAWEKICDRLEKAGYTEKEDFKTEKRRGTELIRMLDGSGGEIQFRTRSTKGGLGEGYDLLIIDEAQEYTADQETALKYIVTDSKNPQTIMCGTPPTAVSSGTVFLNLRKSILTGKTDSAGWAEWSVPTMSDTSNVDLWYETNPSLGTILTERTIRDELGDDQTDDNIQRLGLWIRYNQKGILQNIWNMSRNLLITVKEKFLQGKPKIFHDNTTEKHTKTVPFRQFMTTLKAKILQKIPKNIDTPSFKKQPQTPTFAKSLPTLPKEEHSLNIPENVNTNISDIQPQTFPNVRNRDNSNTLETKNIAVSQSKDFILYAIIILLCLILVVMTAFGIWYFRKFQPNMPAVVLENQETTENVVMELPIQTETVITPTESPILETEMIVETIAPSEIIPVGDIIPQYVFVGGKYTWEEAETNCESYGGHLATVHSDKQWDALINAVAEAKKNNPELRYIWMGATSEVDNNMNLSLSWVDDEETNYIMENTSYWYYNQKSGIREPSGYDAYEYQSSEKLVREPYLLLWKANDTENWTLNDVPDVTNYTNYQNSNMGYIMQLPPDAEIPELETQAPTVAIVLPKRSDPSISGEIKLTHGTSEMGDTNIYTLYVSGNYDSYWIDCDYYGYNGNGKLFSKNETSSSLKLEESTEVYKVIAYITPYYNDGTKGNTITCNYEIKWEEPNAAIQPCYGVGEISSTGVAGFTTSYVVEHGAKKTVRNELGNRWHVTTTSYCYSMGITWYELYDMDDGDYYGWVDGNYINFYELYYGP